MKKSILLSLIFLISFIGFAQEATTFILVRHAEKADDGTRNPPLTDKGEKRAVNLASLLANQEIDALYSTPFKRTEATLQPIAESKNLEIQRYDPNAKGGWLISINQKHPGGTVVISGHSNTIPDLANALLGKESFSQFDDSDYSNLIIIVAREVGKGKLVRLSF